MAKSRKNISRFDEVFNYSSTGKPVVSLYLIVDGARTTKKDYLTKLNSMINNKKKEISSASDINKSQIKKIYILLDEIKNYINETFRPDSTRTLVIFTSGDDFWKEFQIPVIIKSRIIVDPKPYTHNLRSYLSNSKKYGVLLIDREKAQIYSIYAGEINEYLAAFISDVPSKVNFRSNAVLREKKILSRIEEKLHHFFKLVNIKTLELFKEKKFDYLILAGRDELIPDFYNYLHSYLQSKQIGKIDAEPDSKIPMILEKAQKVIEDFENKNKSDMVEKLLHEYNPNGQGVLGIEATIKALSFDQIGILIYERNFIHKGSICPTCQYMTISSKEECPYCDGDLIAYNDIVDEIIESALDKGSEIVDVEGIKSFTEAGSIGAVLRYRLKE